MRVFNVKHEHVENFYIIFCERKVGIYSYIEPTLFPRLEARAPSKLPDLALSDQTGDPSCSYGAGEYPSNVAFKTDLYSTDTALSEKSIATAN